MRAIKSAERTLALFELFSIRQRPMTVGRIASEMQIPQASASMLLANLRDLGYITYDRAARTYTPTIRVALLGSWINHQFDEAGSLTARLSELREQVDETVFVGIQNGAHGQYVLVLHRNKPRSMQVVSGQLKLLTASATGRVLLSLKSDQEVLGWVHRCNAEATEARLRVVPSEFLGLIEQVRRDGYAQTRGDVTPTFGAIAVTVPAPIGLMPMAIGVGVPLERIEAKKEDIIASLRSLKLIFTTLSFDAESDHATIQPAA
jgi:DNA-binding IclR family transcriptional regulator